ncbi:TPR-like protein [Meira miltonrushii]|uniref:TPR-like protein n=1 Tax=Meira miltonrushii TaxID=1280837 RepID=A0A316V6F0_9BASI|nr:TPR-like protein [Meira miltonrushii]PWN32588.1 TPR-like protein [Meira miltonrushii]
MNTSGAKMNTKKENLLSAKYNINIIVCSAREEELPFFLVAGSRGFFGYRVSDIRSRINVKVKDSFSFSTTTIPIARMSSAELKAKGNAAFSAKDYQTAIQHYTDAIAAAKGPEDAVHVLYSNRSACYSGLKQWEKLKDIQANPDKAMTAFQDPRMIQVMGVLMGIDLQAFERPEGSNDLPENLEQHREGIEKQTQPKEAPKPKKAKGNALYMKRQFDEAIVHYQKAWELNPKDITYLNNLAACYFEKGDYQESIKQCEKAIEEGRSLRADYKLVAKAFGRIGSAYDKLDDLDKAISNYEKSLTEHRTPEILNKLRTAEKTLKERQKQAYIDPAKSDEERNRGNDLYKAGDFVGSVQAYTESIKRNPSDPRGYTNRASAYIKLVALPEALKDCEEAIKMDETFTKAYIRKSNVLFSMKDYTKALNAAQMASDIDGKHHNNASSREIQQQKDKIMQALYAERSTETEEETLQRAMRDPEVAQIMQDPVMQSILQQAQSDPRALQDHMRNDKVRSKIEKLIGAGIIRTR